MTDFLARNAAMTPAKFQTAEFRRLQAKWYAKAKRSGFEDLEYLDYATGEPLPDLLRRHSSADLARLYSPDKARYFEMALQYLQHMRDTWQGSSKRNLPNQKRIWGMHAEGLGPKEIARRIGVSEDTVYHRLRKLRARMFAWAKEQR